jgi:hypothetical protein
LCLVARAASRFRHDGLSDEEESPLDRFLGDIGLDSHEASGGRDLHIQVAIATHDPTVRSFANLFSIPVVI